MVLLISFSSFIVILAQDDPSLVRLRLGTATRQAREHPTGTERKIAQLECRWEGGDRGGLTEREKVEKTMERAKHTLLRSS